MKGKFVIEYSEDCKKIEYIFEEELFSAYGYDYVIWIALPPGKNLDYSKIKTGLNKFLSEKLAEKEYQEYFFDRVVLIEKAKAENIDLLDNCDQIEIRGMTTESFNSIPNQENKKKIIHGDEHPLTMESVEEVERRFSNYNNIYVNVQENKAPVLLSEYRKTVEIIDAVVNRIKRYGFSPLEQVLYAYDFARDKIYQSEDENDDYTVSRDLTNVLLREKIVCLGYARIFKTILDKLGINASIYTIKTNDEGHAVVLAHIKDEKYKIDGLYYFDPTVDRKKDETNNHYNRYKSLAIKRANLIRSYDCEDSTFGPLNQATYKKEIEKIKNGQSVAITEGDNISFYINNMDTFMNGGSIYDNYITHLYSDLLVKNSQTVEENVDECFRLMQEQLDPKKKIDALVNVRKIEYYENPEKYPFSSKTIKTIVDNSEWVRDNYYCTESPVNEMLAEKSEEYDRDKAGIDLAKVLRKVRDNKLQ